MDNTDTYVHIHTYVHTHMRSRRYEDKHEQICTKYIHTIYIYNYIRICAGNVCVCVFEGERRERQREATCEL